MSGHSKWSQIKRQKGAADVKRAALYTKFGHTIALAVRDGGKDPSMNASLRLLLEKARAANMPNATIERAIKRGAGELGSGQRLEEVVYEGFGPGGVAVIIDAVTENKNRTAAEIRHLLTKSGGNLGSTGSVQWMFTKRGVITTDTPTLTDQQELAVIDAGADDIHPDEQGSTIITSPEALEKVRTAAEQAGIVVSNAEVRLVPNAPATIADEDGAKVGKFLDELASLDEVNAVATNASLV